MMEITSRRVADLQPHPLANLVPLMHRPEYLEVRDDIRAHGVQVPLDTLGNTVLDGRHRLMIARELRLRTVPCRAIALNGESPVDYMIKMATLRRHLTDDQRAATAALWKQRQARRPGRPKNNSRDAVEVSKAPATAAPRLFNVSRRKVDEDTYLMHRNPKRLAEVHEGRIRLKDALRGLAISEQKRRVARLRPMTGQFSVIVIDPPWPYDNSADALGKRGAIPYPTMSIDQLRGLQIPAASDCLLWLWTTNGFMHDAFHVLESWGFEAKTILTWVKNRIGTGYWLRGQTEHCIVAIKGRPLIELKSQTTVIYGKAREHSRKPDEFFALVEGLCPASDRLEMFAGWCRPGWQRWG